MPQGTSVTTYIDRKSVGEFAMVSKTKSVRLNDLLNIIPDGAKILSMKISNITGRKITVTIPAGSPLILTGKDSAALNSALVRVAYAPITRFPTLKVEIPDLIAANIDTAEPTNIVGFILTTDGSVDNVICKFHYKMAI